MIQLQLLVFALDVYFAAMLGVAGLAKLAHPVPFTAQLRTFRWLPTWLIHIMTAVLPWGELMIAGCLVLGVGSPVVSMVLCALFGSFFIGKIMLARAGQTINCGCYGTAYKQQIDAASMATSAILLGATLLHAWATWSVLPIPSPWRYPVTILFLIIGARLSYNVVVKRRLAIPQRRYSPSTPHEAH